MTYKVYRMFQYYDSIGLLLVERSRRLADCWVLSSKSSSSPILFLVKNSIIVVAQSDDEHDSKYDVLFGRLYVVNFNDVMIDV